MKKLITLMFAGVLSIGLFAQAPNPYPKTINVKGTADLEIIPDEIYVVVTLKEYEKKGSSGKIELETVKTNFLNICRQAGLPDSLITIASYEGFNPKSWWKASRTKGELYATIAYQIKFTNTKKIDELIDKLDDDATQNFEVVRVSHSKIQEYRKQLKIQAIKAAREKALYLTEAVGEKLGEAVTIEELPDNVAALNLANRQATFDNYSLKGDFGKSEEGVDFKKIKIVMGINAVFALK